MLKRTHIAGCAYVPKNLEKTMEEPRVFCLFHLYMQKSDMVKSNSYMM